MMNFATAIMPDEALVSALSRADLEGSEALPGLIDAVRARLDCVGLDRIRAMLAASFEAETTEDDWCYSLCVDALQKRPIAETVAACISWSRDSDPRWRGTAADLLARLADKSQLADSRHLAAARDCVERLLIDLDEEVMGEAVRAFGKLCHTPRTPEEDARLLHFAQHPSEVVRRGVLGVVASLEAAADVPMLILLTMDPLAHIRDWATFALGTQVVMDAPEIRDALLARLQDEDRDTRAEAMRGLAARQDRRAVPAMARELALDDVGSLVIEAACIMPDKSFIAPLEALLADLPGDEDVIAALIACREGTAPIGGGADKKGAKSQ